MKTIAKQLPLFPSLNGKPRTVEAAPGQKVVALPPQEVSRIAVVDLIPTGEPHTYRAGARIHAAEMPLNVETLRKLGLGVSARTMRRLIKGGFVTGTKAAPQVYLFSLQSWFDHCEKVRAAAAEGRDFWTADNLSRYRTVW